MKVEHCFNVSLKLGDIFLRLLHVRIDNEHEIPTTDIVYILHCEKPSTNTKFQDRIVCPSDSVLATSLP